ncbi:carbohydrate ABC transporter permease [Paenibacillus filicis]|uniref:Carbohydrate ABC transporter permease n=1 Tax=Paenibacillus gyeongsangnamensis TaxID=3388067 RepID=A0ABT4Q3V0_9BACL|nr:carbohydrate ABC transporter permease [Paenibacillus filicis]MCZ8511491.1 carbohydrate ABC transporter permease [Paenibacillus filicis]
MLIKQTLEEKAVKIISIVVMGLLSLIVLLPIMYIVQLTFSTSSDASFRILPRGFTLDHYKYVLENELIQGPFLNSLFVTGCSFIVSMVLTIGIAYPLSRRELVGRRFLNFIILLPMILSLGFLPKYLLVKDLGMLNSYSALIFPAALNAFNILIMRNFLESIPASLVESARMDGCSEIKILIKIILPLSTAALATVGLFYMVASWNSYLDVILYINDPKMHTLQVVLRTLVMENPLDSTGADQILLKNIQYTTIVIALIPVMIVYPFLQKYFVKGVLLGSVKG